MDTEQNFVDDTLLDEEIDQLANEIADELEAELYEKAQPEAGNPSAANASPSKPGGGGTGDAPEQAQPGKAKEPKGNKLSKKKVNAEVKTKGQGDDPAEIEVFEEEDVDLEDLEDLDIPETKQEMIRSIFETLKSLDKDSLAGNYSRLMAAMLDEGTEDVEEDEASIPVLERKTITADDIDLTEDLNAIFGENDLSEEFKSQVTTIFEAAVVSKINEEIELIEQEFNAKLEESVVEIAEELTNQIDSYLDYAVDNWMQENELAVERGIKSEITEEFIGGLKQLFEDHYIDVPEEKVDLVDSLADRVEDLEGKLNEAIETNIELNSIVEDYQRDELVNEATAELTSMESEKLRGLSEGVGFEDVDQYRQALDTLKENYFPRTSKGGAVQLDEEAEISENGIVEEAPRNAAMASYVNVLKRTVKE